jgi:hypothetical protein
MFKTVEHIVLRDGETTVVRLDLSSFQTGVIEAQVLHNGVPLPAEQVIPVPVVGTTRSSVKTDSEGWFRCRRLFGQYRLEWSLGRPGIDPGLRSDETITVEADATIKQVFHLRTGTLRVRVLDAGGAPAAKVMLQLRDAAGERRHSLPATDQEGLTQMLVEAETFTCKTLPPHLLDPKAQEQIVRAASGNPDPFAPSLLTLGSVTVQQGATTEVELHLPADYRR